MAQRRQHRHARPHPAPHAACGRRSRSAVQADQRAAQRTARPVPTDVDCVSDRRSRGRSIRVVPQGAPHRGRRRRRTQDDRRCDDHRPRSPVDAAAVHHRAGATSRACRCLTRTDPQPVLAGALGGERHHVGSGFCPPTRPRRNIDSGRQPRGAKYRAALRRPLHQVQRPARPRARLRGGQLAEVAHPGRAERGRGERQRCGDRRGGGGVAGVAHRARRAAPQVAGGHLPGHGAQPRARRATRTSTATCSVWSCARWAPTRPTQPSDWPTSTGR